PRALRGARLRLHGRRRLRPPGHRREPERLLHLPGSGHHLSRLREGLLAVPRVPTGHGSRATPPAPAPPERRSPLISRFSLGAPSHRASAPAVQPRASHTSLTPARRHITPRRNTRAPHRRDATGATRATRTLRNGATRRVRRSTTPHRRRR